MQPEGGHLGECPRAAICVCSQSTRPRQRIEPLRLKGDARSEWRRLVEVIEPLPRARIVIREYGYLHMEFVSGVLRFIDDVELLLDEGNGVIHVRSCSRVGWWDFGVNRRRVEKLRAKFDLGVTEGGRKIAQ